MLAIEDIGVAAVVVALLLGVVLVLCSAMFTGFCKPEIIITDVIKRGKFVVQG